MRRAVLAAVVLSLAVAAAPASARLALAADTSTQPGWIGFYVSSDETFTRVDIAENVDGTSVPLRSVIPSYTAEPGGVVFSFAYYPEVVQWRCDRLTRDFTATGYRPDGSSATTSFNVVTPSCRNRLALIAPRRARPGATVHVRVRDEWELGRTSARVCVRAPGRATHCHHVRLVGTQASLSFVAPRGDSWVSLRTPFERVRAVVSAGVRSPPGTGPLPVILATGDSLMQSVDAQLTDMLAGRANVVSDVHIGSGFSFNAVASWSALPGQQERRFHPRAVVLFIGANDGFGMVSPSGAAVTCCGAPYIAEYARRLRRATETYLHHGSKAVIWLNVPFLRDPHRHPSVAAVDAALPRAVAGIPGATVLDMAQLFTPGGVYHDRITINGRTVRVRESDGVHLSPKGAAIAADAVIQALDRFGVL